MKKPQIYKQTYESGFSSLIIKRPKFNQRFFGIITDFGSSDESQIAGTAHFLEHKLFAKQSGDISLRFEEIGASVNAFTTYNKTMFYASCIDHNSKVIDLIFELVGQPYFTGKNVANEAPIIKQELAMYQDYPTWDAVNIVLKNMFGKSNLAVDIAGTQTTIDQISADNLEQTYLENYQAQNLEFVAVGDFSDTEITKMNNQAKKLQKKYFKVRESPKARKVRYQGNSKRVILNSDNQSSQIAVGVRLPDFKNFLASDDLVQILLQIMLESKLGMMGSWFKQQKDAGLLNNSLQIGVNHTRQGNFILISGTSPDAKKLLDEILKELAQPLVHSQDGSPEFYNFLFKILKNEWFAHLIRSFNDESAMAIEFAENSMDNEDIFDTIQLMQTMGFSEYQQVCDNIMKQSKITGCAIIGTKGR